MLEATDRVFLEVRILQRKGRNNLVNIVAYTLIGTIAYVLMLLEIPLPVTSFLKFDFSDVVITIGTFLFGPLPGIFIAFVRMLINLIYKGFALPSLVGQSAAFLASISFALPFYYLTVPNLPAIHGYSGLLAFTEKVYLGKLLHIPSMSAYIFGIIVPFNLLKGAINGTVVYLLFETVLRTIKPFVRKNFNLKN